MTNKAKKLAYDAYTVGIICPLEVEMSAVRYMLDEEHVRLPGKDGDRNRYILGQMGDHNAAIGYLPQGSQGIGAAAIVATDMRRTFPSIQLRLLVGIGGGIPSKKHHICLGDVVIGMPDGIHGGVIQYDLGKRTVDGFERKGHLCPPPDEWRTAVVEMKSDHRAKSNRITEFLSKMLETYPKLQEYSRPGSELDILFPPDSKHVRDEPTCDKCDKAKVIPLRSLVGPDIFYGTIASGDSVIKNAEIRDELCKASGGALCFDMEAAGLSNGFPCIVIRGICDYADSHKNDQWHPYAAAVAAACAKELLTYIDLAPGTKSSAYRNYFDDSPMLRSDSIFLQERLLIRPDISSFLAQALSRDGHVLIVLHGLPGVGKTTVARSFACNAQKDMAILWIPGSSEVAIEQAFEQYAMQICGNDQQHSQPMSFVTHQLSERFSGRWLLIYDGLDLPYNNIQKYLFAKEKECKILITTRNKDLASDIKGAHDFPMNPLNEQLGQELLDVYMRTDPESLTAGQVVQTEQTSQDMDGRNRIVKELGGLPLAIAVVGAALRGKSGNPSISSSAYLAWPDEVKGMLLEQDSTSSDYPSSVWKAFQFAFQGILQGTGINEYAMAMSHFTASCENASNLTEYIRLYRKSRAGVLASNRSATVSSSHCGIGPGWLRFLEDGYFSLAINALAAVNMVTLNWMKDGPDDVPHIEMHSLVRRWLLSMDHDKVYTHPFSKMWLLGFGMYSQLKWSRAGTSRFAPLLTEVSKTHIPNNKMNADSQVLAVGAVLALLLDAHVDLLSIIQHLPVVSAQRSRLRSFSRELESEFAYSYEENLKDFDWISMFNGWARELGKCVVSAVDSNAQKDEYTVDDFCSNALECYRGILRKLYPIAPHDIQHVGQTDTMQEIQVKITTRTESLLTEHLDQQALRYLSAITSDGSSTSIRTWSERWQYDVAEIIRNSLAEVFVKLQSAEDIQRFATEVPSLLEGAAAEPQSAEDSLYSLPSSSDPRNAFFAVLRRTVKAATIRFLNACPTADILNGQRGALRDMLLRAARKDFGDQVTDDLDSRLISSGIDSIFHVLWELARQIRFPGNLDDLIAEKTFNAVSEDLTGAIKRGFSGSISKNCLDLDSSFVEELTREVFNTSAIRNPIANWTTSGWFDPLSDSDDDSDDEEPIYIRLIHDSKQQIMSAMKIIYEDPVNAVGKDTAVRLLKSTFDCRKGVHNEIIRRLKRAKSRDQVVGPTLTISFLHFDHDNSFRIACSFMQTWTSEDLLGSLDHLIHVEETCEPSGRRSKP